MTRAAALFAAAALCAGCARSGPREPPETPPEVTLYGVRMNHYRGGEVAALGRAARVTYRRSSGELTAYESWFRFPNRLRATPGSGRAEPAGMEVRAPLVVGNLASRQAHARGGVVLRSSAGLSGETERMSFDGAAMIAQGESRVRMTAPGYTLGADRFRLWFEREEFTFEGNVESTVGGQP